MVNPRAPLILHTASEPLDLFGRADELALLDAALSGPPSAVAFLGPGGQGKTAIVQTWLRRLTTPFIEWDAYRLGVIDGKGNVLKKRRDLTTIAEREAFTTFDLMICNMKKALALIPGGSSKTATYAAALWLIREFNEEASEQQLVEAVRHYYRSQMR